MATYLLTVKKCYAVNMGLRLEPGIWAHEAQERPGIKAMIQGCKLELRLPAGTKRITSLVTYGVAVTKGEDGTLYMEGDPKDPEVRLTLPVELTPAEVPVGTEVWLLDATDC